MFPLQPLCMRMMRAIASDAPAWQSGPAAVVAVWSGLRPSRAATQSQYACVQEKEAA